MKKLLLLLALSTSAFGQGDKFIDNPNNGKDVVIRGRNSTGILYELGRFSPPFGDSLRTVGTVGALPGVQGYLVDSSFPDTTNLHYYNLLTDANDEIVSGAINLTSNGTPSFEGYGLFGAGVAKLDGVDDNFSSTNAFFNPGNGVSWSVGGWVKASWKQVSGVPFSNHNSNADRKFAVFIDSTTAGTNGSGSTSCSATNTAGSFDVTISVPTNFEENSWHHLVCVYDFGATTLRYYIDGQLSGSASLANTRAVTSPIFRVGALGTSPSLFIKGNMQDVFFKQTALTSTQVNSIYSKRYTNHAQLAGGHTLSSEDFPFTNEDNVAWWDFLGDANDDSGATSCSSGSAACNLTNNNSIPFTGIGIFGETTTPKLNGSNQSFSSTDAFFNPGNNRSFAWGGWFAHDSWFGSDGDLISNTPNNSTDNGYTLTVEASGVGGRISCFGANAANASVFGQARWVPIVPFIAGSWHHIACVFSYEDKLLKLYVDGVLRNSGPLVNIRSVTSSLFRVGARTSTPSQFAPMRAQNVFFIVDHNVTSADMRRLFSAKVAHNKGITAASQSWSVNLQAEDFSPFTIPALNFDWLADMRSNNLYVDFSRFEPGTKVLINNK